MSTHRCSVYAIPPPTSRDSGYPYEQPRQAQNLSRSYVHLPPLNTMKTPPPPAVAVRLPTPTSTTHRFGISDPASHAYMSTSYRQPTGDERAVAADGLLSLACNASTRPTLPSIQSFYNPQSTRTPSHSRTPSLQSSSARSPTNLSTSSCSSLPDRYSPPASERYSPAPTSNSRTYSTSPRSTYTSTHSESSGVMSTSGTSVSSDGIRTYFGDEPGRVTYAAPSVYARSDDQSDYGGRRYLSTSAPPSRSPEQLPFRPPTPKCLQPSKSSTRGRKPTSSAAPTAGKPKAKQGPKKRSPGYVRPIIVHRKAAGQRLLEMLHNAPVPSFGSPQSVTRVRTFPFFDLNARLHDWYGLRMVWPEDAVFKYEELKSTRRMKAEELKRLDVTLDSGNVKLVLCDAALEKEPHRAHESSLPGRYRTMMPSLDGSEDDDEDYIVDTCCPTTTQPMLAHAQRLRTQRSYTPEDRLGFSRSPSPWTYDQEDDEYQYGREPSLLGGPGKRRLVSGTGGAVASQYGRR